MPHPTYRIYPSFRLGIILLVQIAVMLINCCVAAMSFGIICMTNSTNFEQNPTAVNHSDVACVERITKSDNGYQGSLAWTREEQSLVLLGMPIGSVLSTLPLSVWVGSFGVKRVAAASMLLCGITTILTPMTAIFNFYLLLFLRVLFGIGTGIIWSFALTVCVQWSPKEETGRIIALSSSGIQVGYVIVLISSGYFCASIGWQYIFYLWGGALILWTLLFIIVFNTPNKIKGISDAERCYIENGVTYQKIPFAKLPLRSLFSSVSIWATAIHWATSWFLDSFHSLLVPTYLKEVLVIPSTINGIVSACILLGELVGRIMCGVAVDKLFNRFGDINSMRICAIICTVGPAIALLALSFIDCTRYVLGVVFAIALSVSMAFGTGSYIRCPSVVAPRYTSHLTGFFTTSGYIVVIVQILTVGQITTNGTLEEWRSVFLITIAVTLFGMIVFLVFVDWGNPITAISPQDHKSNSHTTPAVELNSIARNSMVKF